jgi:hypothetical protein
MSFRDPDYEVWYDMPLMDMWYGVAHDIFMDGFIAAGGSPYVGDTYAIELMAKEFYRTAEHYRLKGPTSLGSMSYRERYRKLQPSHSYNDMDKELWVDNVWYDVTERVANVVSELEYHRTSWLVDTREMYHLHPNVVLGMLWAIAHIPNENERNQTADLEGEYESDG